VNNKNVLLIKDNVGSAKPSTYNLPNIHFTYGKAPTKDPENAKEVCMTWKYHNPSNQKFPDRDFKSLNKMSLTAGFHRSEHQSSFRRNNDARLKLVQGKTEIPLFIPEIDHRYGKTNRPSTPVKLVLGNCFGLEAQRIIENEYQ